MSNIKTIYCLPGLGQDHRVFDNCTIKDVGIQCLDWIAADAADSLEDYARKMLQQIDTSEAFALIGVSLGGIIAIEISRIVKVEKLYLISTIKNADEKPLRIEWLGKLPTSSTTLPKFAVEASKFLKPFYGNADQTGIELFNTMLNDADLEFIRWGWEKIPQWDFRGELNCPFMHLHGTADLVFPIKNIDQALTLKGATHYAIFNDHEKISNLINQDLKSLKS